MGEVAARSRRELRAEKRKDEILDVARVLCLENDFSSVTMEAVASEVLLSRVALYQYFPNRMDLFGSILIRDCIAKGIARSEIRDVDPKTAALAHWSLLMGAAYASVTGYARRQNLDETTVSTFGLRTFIAGMTMQPGGD